MAMASNLHVAYLVNQYPKVSHTFIRREILALEALGLKVNRFAVRGWDAPVVDAADREEQRRTRYVLEPGLASLLVAAARTLVMAPVPALRGFICALRLGWRADRALPVHLVYWAEACVVLAWARQARVEHLHAHFGTNAAEVALLVAAMGGPPFSFTVHGPEEFDKPLALKLDRKMAAAAFVVAISSFGRSQLWRWCPHDAWNKVHVVHCGLDTEFLDAAVTPVPDTLRLVCVGRLCEQKGQMLLLEAAARIVESGTPLHLVLAGDGEMRPQIDARIVALGLSANVEVTGWIGAERVQQELQAARALVLPSFAEGLPVVLMEAMALQRPVVTTAIAGVPELVRHGVEGWIATAGDLDALVQAIRACLSASSSELDEMGQRARARVRERHDSHREAVKLAELFSGSRAGTLQ